MVKMRMRNGAAISKELLSKSKQEKKNGPSLGIDPEEGEKARQLLLKVLARIQTRTGYIRLVTILGFFTMYVMAVLLQQRVEDSFAVESR